MKWQMYPPVLTSSGQEWQFQVSHKQINLQMYPTSTQNLADKPSSANGPLLLTSSGQEWHCHIVTDI